MRSLAAAAVFLALSYQVSGISDQQPSSAQTYPPPFPRPNATKLLETDRLVVWDIVWPKGQPTALHRHVNDQVGTYYQAGGRVITSPDGTARPSTTPVGNLSTTKKGTLHIEEGTTDPPLRAVFVEMKMDTPSGLPDTPSDIAPVFPREGAKQLHDDERVTVWDYSWTPGAKEIARRYPRDAVIVWMGSGKMRSTRKGGAPARIDTVAGKMQYMTRGTVLTEAAVEGTPRAFVFEFK